MDRSVKSATRVFELLEVFERQRRPLRVAELVRELDAPQSSVSMLLQTLVSEGYLEFNGSTREFCPSVRVANLCEWVGHLPHRPRAIPEALRNLAADTGETVLLGRIEGIQMRYVAVIHSRKAVRFVPCCGTRRPLHRTAIGIMLLSTLAKDRIALMLRHFNAEHGEEAGQANIPWTLREAAAAGELGYYQSGGLATPGAGVISMLLPTPIRGQRLAAGVGAPLDRLQLNKASYRERLREAVAQC
jgi:IclR family acetate operon transcriptional repressor